MAFRRLISLFLAVALTTDSFAFSHRGRMPEGWERKGFFQNQAIPAHPLDIGTDHRPPVAAYVNRAASSLRDDAYGSLGLSDDEIEVIDSFVRRHLSTDTSLGSSHFPNARLLKIAQRAGMSLPELIAKMSDDTLGLLHRTVLDALMINHTSFFREPAAFTYLCSQFISRWRRLHPTEVLRIWSAACSTGEEAYSLAMAVLESFPALAQEGRIEIVATDQSLEALNIAQKGLYRISECLEIGRNLQRKYFRRDGKELEVEDFIRSMVKFLPLNLLNPWPKEGLFQKPFDIVFLRNVLIYYGEKTWKAVLERMGGYLQPDGCLVLGEGEGMVNQLAQNIYQQIFPNVYQRRSMDSAA